MLIKRVRARALVAEPDRELERPLAPLERLLGVLGEHRELGERRCRRGRARPTRRAARGSRSPRAPSTRAASPSPANQWNRDRTRVQRPTAASSPRLPEDRDRALDRREGVLEPADEVGGVRQLLEHGRLLGQPGAGRRSPRRAGSGSTPRGSTPAPPPAARRRARTRRRRPPRRRLRRGATMSAGSASAASRAARISAWRRRRAAIGTLDLIAFRASSCRKRTYRGSTSSSCRRSGSSAAAAQPGITASSTEVRDAVRHDRDELHQAPRVVVEPRRSPQDGVRDRGRQLVGRSGTRAAR